MFPKVQNSTEVPVLDHDLRDFEFVPLWDVAPIFQHISLAHLTQVLETDFSIDICTIGRMLSVEAKTLGSGRGMVES
jgi:hypothetical protein